MLDNLSRKGTEAVQDRNVRLSNLQSKIEELSREKVRAVEDSGSEVASLELKLATAIKDNGELLRRNRWGGEIYVTSRVAPTSIFPRTINSSVAGGCVAFVDELV